MSATEESGDSGQQDGAGHPADCSKRLLRILDGDDVYLIFSKLKQQKFKSSVRASDDVLTKLFEYIRRYAEHRHVVETGFNAFMNGLMKKIRPESIRLHIKCLSYLDDVDLEHFRGLYGYNKIYGCFKTTVADLFTENTDHRNIEILIRLLNNNQLVYKNLLPIVSKLNSYATKDVVDRNIAACCSVLDAVTRYCPDRFNDTLIISLLGYLAKLLHSPQSFLFLGERETTAIISALRTLSAFDFSGTDAKSSSRGLLRECIGKIVEYRHSTVYEEILVVVYMTEILAPIFDLCIRYGNRSIDFIDPKFLDFDIVKPRQDAPGSENGDRPASKSKECDFYKLSRENEMKYGSESSLEKTRLSVLQSRFIEAKYLFLDRLSPFADSFDRVAFYNDLLKVGDPIQLFRNIPALKKQLDWSDLIVYACNAHCRASYMPIILDEYYTRQPSHQEYVQMFLNSLKENPEDIVPFATAATERHFDLILMDIYLVGIDDRPVVRRARNIILRYLIDYAEDEKKDDGKLITKLKNRLSMDRKDGESSAMERIVEDCARKLAPQTPSKHVAALFLVFISKKIGAPAQMRLYKHMKECLDSDGGCSFTKRAYVCLCALILNRNGLGIFDVEDRLTTVYDVVVALLSYKTAGDGSKSHLKRIKENGFELLFGASEEQLAEIGALSGYGSVSIDDSLYFREFTVLDEILRPKTPE